MPFSFVPTCSLPPENTKFTSTPNVRGTLDIVWTCFSILLLCTWTVQHLNIQPLIKPRTIGQYFHWIIFFIKRKAKWMILTLIAPEILIGLALSQFVAARYGRDMMQGFANEDGVEWTLEHSHFADMGGFVINFPDTYGPWDMAEDDKMAPFIREHEVSTLSSKGSDDRPLNRLGSTAEVPSLRRAVTLRLLPRGVISVIKTPKDPRTQSLSASLSRGIKHLVSHPERGIEALRQQWASTQEGEQQWKRHDHNSSMVDSILKKPSDALKHYSSVEVFYEGVAVLSGNLWVLNTQQLFLARKFGIIKSLPSVTMEEIDDKNKGDAVVKLLALVTVAWLILQLIVRRVRGLPSTQLEIMTLAFAGSTFIIYILLWFKPQDALVPIYITADSDPTKSQLQDISQKRAANTFGFQTSGGRAPFWIPDNSVHDTGHKYRDFYLDIGVGAGAVLFGALHLLSWNQHFPTPLERLLWRISLSIAVGIPPLFLVMSWNTIRITNLKARWLAWCNASLLLVAYIVLPVLYVLARAYVLVEVFRAMAFLPPRTFIATFTAEIPHFG
ncbi:hypothetical protein BT63DRAFT_443287 [Microthyrium microscopicum]|uniref:Uncharacterized protein n=1 Tax=Microthyrium microscopicum TaxID=703497 RepID=A0A6A6U205_9PEZI|nr:hypothetical protein BT63DRAFT_443287 [Microthyrium microscopicum]